MDTLLKGKYREWWLDRVTPDFENGLLYSNYSGKVIENKSRSGYLYASISCGKGRPKIVSNVHVILMYLKHGKLPEDLVVDHIDQDKTNNRADNLRFVTRSKNNSNIDKSNSNSKVKSRGVSLCKRSGKYIAQICKDRKVKFLGRFDTEEDAKAEYERSKEILFGV